MKLLKARWETRGKRHWLELHRNDFNGQESYEYSGDGMGGNLGYMNYENAIAIMERKVAEFSFYDHVNMKKVF